MGEFAQGARGPGVDLDVVRGGGEVFEAVESTVVSLVLRMGRGIEWHEKGRG